MSQDIFNKLAVEFNLDSEIIEKIVRSEFEFVMNTMEEGNFESVHLHKLGKYAVKPNRLKQLNHDTINTII